MSLGSGCANCCAVFSATGIVLLMLFGAMFQRGAMTFEVASAKFGWDMQQKAQSCFMGAVIYGVTLFISVMAKILMSKSNATPQH